MNQRPVPMAKGWPVKRAIDYQRQHADALFARPVELVDLSDENAEEAAALVRSSIKGLSLMWSPDGSTQGGIVGFDEAGSIFLAVILGGEVVGDRGLVRIHHIAVAPSWRRLGVGTAALAILPQVVERRLGDDLKTVTYLGHCAPEMAEFYQRSGYTVFHPGDVVPVRGFSEPLVADNANYPCLFVRGERPAT